MDTAAIATAKTALAAALASLADAYKASQDARVESLVADLISTIEEGAADLRVIEGQIEDDRDPTIWFARYAAA